MAKLLVLVAILVLTVAVVQGKKGKDKAQEKMKEETKIEEEDEEDTEEISDDDADDGVEEEMDDDDDEDSVDDDDEEDDYNEGVDDSDDDNGNDDEDDDGDDDDADDEEDDEVSDETVDEELDVKNDKSEERSDEAYEKPEGVAEDSVENLPSQFKEDRYRKLEESGEDKYGRVKLKDAGNIDPNSISGHGDSNSLVGYDKRCMEIPICPSGCQDQFYSVNETTCRRCHCDESNALKPAWPLRGGVMENRFISNTNTDYVINKQVKHNILHESEEICLEKLRCPNDCMFEQHTDTLQHVMCHRCVCGSILMNYLTKNTGDNGSAPRR